jgi:hypothetical protein
MTNKMQLFWFIYSKSALHVSGGVFAHHQEHLSVFTASDIVHRYCCWLVSRMRWNCSTIILTMHGHTKMKKKFIEEKKNKHFHTCQNRTPAVQLIAGQNSLYRHLNQPRNKWDTSRLANIPVGNHLRLETPDRLHDRFASLLAKEISRQINSFVSTTLTAYVFECRRYSVANSYQV